MEISIPDAKALFQSIRSAYDLREIQQVKAGDLIWTTDGRAQPRSPDRMVIEIKFDRTLGSTRTSLSRQDIAAALDQFEKKLFSAL